MFSKADYIPKLATKDIILEFFTARNAVILICTWFAYQLLRIAWNVSPLHPLSHIPGPRLAAATYLPEFYWDVVNYGRYTRKIIEMHKIYGRQLKFFSEKAG